MSLKWQDKSNYYITKLISRCACYGAFLFMFFYLLGSGTVAVVQAQPNDLNGPEDFVPLSQYGWSQVTDGDAGGIFGGDGYPNLVAHPDGSPRT